MEKFKKLTAQLIDRFAGIGLWTDLVVGVGVSLQGEERTIIVSLSREAEEGEIPEDLKEKIDGVKIEYEVTGEMNALNSEEVTGSFAEKLADPDFVETLTSQMNSTDFEEDKP